MLLFFTRLPRCKASSRVLVSVLSFDADQSHELQNLLQPINISVPCRFARSAALICTQVWFMAKQLSVFAPAAALFCFFFDVHLCVIKVTPRSRRRGERYRSRSNGKNKSAQPAGSEAKRAGAQPWPPWNPSDPDLFHLNSETVGWLSAYLSVLCVLFLFVLLVQKTNTNNLNENKAKDSVPRESRVLRWVFF